MITFGNGHRAKYYMTLCSIWGRTDGLTQRAQTMLLPPLRCLLCPSLLFHSSVARTGYCFSIAAACGAGSRRKSGGHRTRSAQPWRSWTGASSGRTPGRGPAAAAESRASSKCAAPTDCIAGRTLAPLYSWHMYALNPYCHICSRPYNPVI